MHFLEFMMEIDIQHFLALKKYDAIYNRTGYLIERKSAITFVFCHCYAKIKVNCYDSFLTEKYRHCIML